MADRITELSLEAVMGERFGRYSKYIIQERALPDIRDGLKPVQRRILFAMNQDGNTHDKAYRKSAKSVGNVMGNFHPHGDSSIYEAMVRLSQDWKVREPLIDMSGNNGSIDADPPAAMRYTEARLSKIAAETMADLDKETVEMVLNFDDTTYEPTVLPSRIPNLFINGATGISAGYATDIPPHNLTEINKALLHLLDKPEATVKQLMRFVKGPDFPTGGIIQGIDGIAKAYETGKGKIIVRAKTEIRAIKGGKQQIEVTEIPYEVTKSTLVAKIDTIRLNKEIPGIAEVRDESDREGLSIVIELTKEANAQGILTYLFKKTDLQVAYNFNMVAIHNQRPERVSLKAGLVAFLDFRREVILKRSAFELAKAQSRQHIVEGLIRMMSILDDVVAAIRASKNRKDATQNLVDQFQFSQAQAEAIVTLQLYRLTNTDVVALENEHAELAEKIATLQLILSDEDALKDVIRTEINAISKAYGSPRRSEIEAEVEALEIDAQALIAEEDVAVLISRNGYFKRASLRSYTASGDENGLVDGDVAMFEATLNTRQHLLLVTEQGNVIYRPVHELPDAKWKDAGAHFSQQLTNWASEDRILAVFVLDDMNSEQPITLVTNDGFIKQTTIADLTPGRTYKSKSGMAVKLKTAQSRVIAAFMPVDDAGDVVLFSHDALALRYPLAEVPIIGARTAGVKAMDLRGEDRIMSAVLVKNDADLLAIFAQNGAFKTMKAAEIAPTSRARKGVQIFTQKKTVAYNVAAAINVESAPALQIITDREQLIELQISDYKSSQRVGNGQYVIDTAKMGTPILVKLLELAHENA